MKVSAFVASVFVATAALVVDVPTASAQAPGAFGKVSPSNGATGVARNPTVLTWAASSGATSYEYCITSSASCFSYTSVGNVLSVNVSGLGASMPFTWQVRAVNANGTTLANGGTFWTFTTKPIPGPFSKTSPSDFASLQPTNPTLSWGSSSNATDYEYCIDTTNDNACTGWTSAGASTSVGLSGLSTCTTYHWQIRANNAPDVTYADGSSTSFRRFSTICPPGAFGKTSPANGLNSVAGSVALSWGTASGTSSYEYCYDTTNDNACSAWTSAGTNTSATISGLSAAAAYYWHVRANGGGATTYADGSNTTFWTFTTGPGAFGKTSPTNGATGVSTSPALTWGASSGATSYEYCYDTTNDGACSAWTSVGGNTSANLSGLSVNVPYSWHVRANGPTGTTYANGSSTAFWPFMTGNAGLVGSVQALVVDPSNSQTVYAGTTQGVYKSVNGGNTWTRLDSGLTYTNVRALAIRPESPCTIVAGIDTNINNQGGFPTYFITNSFEVLAVTTDCGVNWGIPSGGPSGRRTESLAFSNTVPSVLYAAIVRNDATCSTICSDLQKGTVSRVVLGTSYSTDIFFSFLPINIVATDPANPCTAYYALSDYPFSSGTVYQNISCSGGSWAAVGSAFNAAVTALVVHPTNQATLLAGTRAGGIFRKIDGLSPWVSVASVSGAVNRILYEPGSSLVAYAVVNGGAVHKTTDGGGTWNVVNSIGSPLAALAISPTSTSTIYVGGNTFVLSLDASVEVESRKTRGQITSQ